MDKTILGYGIDLGTSNACIAVRTGGTTEVLKNHEDRELTPCAVWVDKHNLLVVGRVAKERVEHDPGNAFSEFKLQMGTGTVRTFERSGRRMTPEELSAEVLKALLANVQQRRGERPAAAVITVPAAFDLPQCDATMTAAKLAGLRASPLLTEPVAAALAYGYQSEREGAYWLVYDFGGGTFDAAVITLRDGMLEVVTHKGDNHLGGKSIDWAIVDDILIPAITKAYRVTEFGRMNPKWRGAIAKLKGAAKEAKIRLFHSESAEISIVFLCPDDHGNPIQFDHTLTRKDVERLAEPLIRRSIDLCKESLASKRLDASAIGKLLLVGDPTQMPYLRSRLEEELKISLEFGLDPMTIVAQGAALFASMQRFEEPRVKPTVRGEFALHLEGPRVGPDADPQLGGKVLAEGTSNLGAFTIEFMNTTTIPPWKSGKIGLSSDGSFITNLWAEKGHVNRFEIELCDEVGKPCKTTPDYWEYEVGLPMIHSIFHSLRMMLPSGQFRTLSSKGEILPIRRRFIVRLLDEGSQGPTPLTFRFPLYEGEAIDPEDNCLIGACMLDAGAIASSLLADSDVELTITIDESWMLSGKAYIPILDKEFELHCDLGYIDINLDHLRARLARYKQRHEALSCLAQEQADERTRRMLQRIQQEVNSASIEDALAQGSALDTHLIFHFESRLRLAATELDACDSMLRESDHQRNRAVMIQGLTELYGNSPKGGT